MDFYLLGKIGFARKSQNHKTVTSQLITLFKHDEVFSCLQSHQHLDIRVFSKRLYYETLAKHRVHDSDFFLPYIHRLAR